MEATITADHRTERMIRQAKEAGMPRDQVDRFIRAGYVILPDLMSFHVAAREADLEAGPEEIALGGSRGPGKSHAVMAQVGLDDCQRFRDLKGLYLRKVMKSAAESADDLIRKVFRFVPHVQTASGVEFPDTGSRFVIGGYNNERDIDKYLGIEYDFVVIEESTQLTEDKHEKIHGSLRTTKPYYRARKYHTTNADGAGLSYFKKKFVIPARLGKEIDTRFYDLNWRSNPFLKKQYTDWLQRLKGPLGKAWRDADWDAFAGMAFTAWDWDRHVREPFDIPEHWIKWRAVDEGTAAPFCCLWLTRNPDTRRTYVYREAYQAGLTTLQQANLVLDMTPPNEKIAITYADPALWQTKNFQGVRYTSADQWRDAGIQLTPGDNNRLEGKRKIDQALADLPDGWPALQIFSTVPHLPDQLSSLAYDDIHIEDVDTDQEDHAFDALKYGYTNERRVQTNPNKPQRHPMARVKGI